MSNYACVCACEVGDRNDFKIAIAVESNWRSDQAEQKTEQILVERENNCRNLWTCVGCGKKDIFERKNGTSVSVDKPD